MPNAGRESERLALGALQWLAACARTADGGLTWSGTPSGETVDPTLYSGGAGVVLAFLEAHRHFDDDRWADAAAQGARALATATETGQHRSLYFGTTGMAVALHAVGERLRDPEAARAAGRALAQVKGSFDGERWGPQFDLLGGNAGIALGALAAGDGELAGA